MSNENKLKLLTREETSQILEPTENLQFLTIGPESHSEVIFGGEKDNLNVRIVKDKNVDDGEYIVNDQVLKSAARSVGIPQSYVRKCPVDLLLPHLNYWFNHRREKVKVIIKDRNLLGFTNRKVNSNPVSNERLLILAENSVDRKNILGYHQVANSLLLTTTAVVTSKTFEPVVNDKLYGGLKIQNSIIGENSIEISPYIFRQICVNGAITQESLGSYRNSKDNSGLDDWVLETSGKACSMLDEEFERIQHLTTIDVSGHVPDTIQGICKDKQISQKIQEEILDEASRSNAKTMYDVWNCITRIASHNTRLSPLAVGRLQRIAGSVSKENEICPSCYRILN